jgi:phosphoribosyl 1,2-cyclic phosphodiesterase
MRLAVLASGSSGNALAVEHEGVTLFLDGGLSYREHRRRLEQSGLAGINPVALFLSHEHSDHVSGAGVLARKWGIPLHATSGTFDRIGGRLGKVPETVPMANGETVQFGPMSVTGFSLPHDAVDPSGYVIEWNGGRLGVATDLGSPGPLVEQMRGGCSSLVLKFNHDLEMLWSGTYPWPLKQRIASGTGHLSNEAAAGLLGNVDHRGLEVCVLAHLSAENNLPGLALEAARAVLGEDRKKVYTGRQDSALPVLDLE